jgi:predicted nucleic acid-binding Zn ribbon protein
MAILLLPLAHNVVCIQAILMMIESGETHYKICGHKEEETEQTCSGRNILGLYLRGA